MSSLTSGAQAGTLEQQLDYRPEILKFGTSGRRGPVVHLTQLEVYLNASAELSYLQSLPREQGGIVRGETFPFAYDLRPSSTGYSNEEQGRGGIAQAIVRAILDAGMKPLNLGAIPTPALTYYALSLGTGSIMVTGSHIPFDRNGYKTNTSRGELMKHHEQPIAERVARLRQELYARPFEESLFDQRGMFKDPADRGPLPPAVDEARRAYVDRYVSFFAGRSLAGLRLLFYQHSSVGRDLVPQILRQLGAEVITAGRSETFVPIDTENIDAAVLAVIQKLVDDAVPQHGKLDAVVSTDGDSDRPLLLDIDRASGQVRFFGGDLLGMIVAQFLKADAVVVPISCNDAIDRGALAPVLQPKTKIGSPFVIAGMQQALSQGKRVVCGWEANGGFLTGSDIVDNGKVLKALPTRDAVLPILCVLFSAHEQGLTLSRLFDTLPHRYSRAALLKNFPRAVALQIVERFSPKSAALNSIDFSSGSPRFLDAAGAVLSASGEEKERALSAHDELASVFSAPRGFGPIATINYTDGVRMIFADGQVAHLRPSGNADEFRIYAVAGDEARSEAVVAMGIAEPGGLLRSLERLAG